jgi:hypothetical protein
MDFENTNTAAAVAEVPDEGAAAPVTPHNYTPPNDIEVSSHLSFVGANVPHDLEVQRDFLEARIAEVADTTNYAVHDYLKAELVKVETAINTATQNARETNARRLAERVIHKYRKWGPVRFGEDEINKNCFYTGDQRVDNDGNPIQFDELFRNWVCHLAQNSTEKGIPVPDGETILANLHIGYASAVRFADFIIVNIPEPDPVPDEDYGSGDESDSGEETD